MIWLCVIFYLPYESCSIFGYENFEANSQDYVVTQLLAVVALETLFYTDDLLTGYDSVEQVKLLQNQLIDVLRRTGMNLHGRLSNEPELIKDFTLD